MRGHARKRGSTWTAVWDEERADDSKRRQRWKGGFDTKKDAETFLRETLGAIEQGSYVRPAKLTVSAYLDEWLAAMKAKVRPSTWASYEMIVRVHLKPALGNIPLQRLTTERLEALYAKLSREGRHDGKGGLSPRSVRLVHATIHRALKDAVRTHRTSRNVAETAEPPKGETKEARTWTAAELRKFLEHVGDDALYPAFVVAATTGMRRGEVLGLRWQDVHLDDDKDAGRIEVRQTLIAPGYKLTFSKPKTKRGERSLALDPTTVKALKDHRAKQLDEMVNNGFPAAELVFVLPDGSPVHPDLFSAAFGRHAKAAKLPTIRLHDLRHSHATLALQAGVHPKIVSERLGHSSVAFTLDRYSHAIPALEETAAALVASLVFETETASV